MCFPETKLSVLAQPAASNIPGAFSAEPEPEPEPGGESGENYGEQLLFFPNVSAAHVTLTAHLF